ncbi:hypothetical protein [Parapedobacter koreensis]|uniref:Uncharacterized protein n=1 Tax=Parapedobacter koreensis TaxID=332977 RepID=A0A1H7T9A8_9SPHI|nr:hypothetical protein [Parapedobacter koreensis]SEL81115.1 hypothetical protein SAMN05421740_110152 [Parapedobacter koreensis]
MKTKINFRPYVGYFFAVLFSLNLASNTLFMHSHSTVNGRVIIHVHPYKLNKKDGQQHRHSERGLYMLDYTFHAALLLETPQSICVPAVSTYKRIFAVPQVVNTLQPPANTAYLRGPPMC